jgi:hypothetical protein
MGIGVRGHGLDLGSRLVRIRVKVRVRIHIID